MTYSEPSNSPNPMGAAPGDPSIDETEIFEGVKSYLIGLGLATLLTIISFFIAGTTLVWAPSIPVALVVLAIAQMGVHLVFFLHITTGPDNVNNVMALAFGLLVVLLILSGSLWIMAHLNHDMGHVDNAMQAPPERGGANRIVTATGVVGPAATEAVAARASGEIQALNCDANMRVKAGQLCAKIDPAPYQIAIDRYRAELTAANAQFEKDKADLAQAKAAFQKKEGRSKHSDMRLAVDKLRSAFERAQAQTEQDETAVAELRATLHAAETNLGYTDIVAPIDGTVVSRNVEKGQRVTAGSEKPLFVFAADLTSARIDAMVSAKGRADIKLGDQVTFTVEALPNHSFTGAVTQIHPIFEASEHAAAYDVVITAPNEDLLLKPGMAATTMIVIE